jgi:hypothetical protein
MNDYLKERDKWYPVSSELLASYRGGLHTKTVASTLMRYKNGQWHRDADKPVRIAEDGSLGWFKNGVYHRGGDKPARIGTDGTLGWFKNGVYHRDGDKPAEINPKGTLGWYKNGEKHRDGDKPAWISAAGTLGWYRNGECHRDGDKPARVYAFGKLEWLKNGLLHRTTGPAVIRPDNKREYWINGVNVTKEVESWLKTRKYQDPFTPDQQVEFTLTFG